MGSQNFYNTHNIASASTFTGGQANNIGIQPTVNAMGSNSTISGGDLLGAQLDQATRSVEDRFALMQQEYPPTGLSQAAGGVPGQNGGVSYPQQQGTPNVGNYALAAAAGVWEGTGIPAVLKFASSGPAQFALTAGAAAFLCTPLGFGVAAAVAPFAAVVGVGMALYGLSKSVPKLFNAQSGQERLEAVKNTTSALTSGVMSGATLAKTGKLIKTGASVKNGLPEPPPLLDDTVPTLSRVERLYPQNWGKMNRAQWNKYNDWAYDAGHLTANNKWDNARYIAGDMLQGVRYGAVGAQQAAGQGLTRGWTMMRTDGSLGHINPFVPSFAPGEVAGQFFGANSTLRAANITMGVNLLPIPAASESAFANYEPKVSYG